jgi:hypothetical protein
MKLYMFRNCPKHVEFHSKNKFEQSARLVGFIIQIYHDARLHERHIQSSGTSILSKANHRCTVKTSNHVMVLFSEVLHHVTNSSL